MYHSFPTLVDFEQNFEKEFEFVIERNLRGRVLHSFVFFFYFARRKRGCFFFFFI